MSSIKERDPNDPNVKFCGVAMDLDVEKSREYMKHPDIDVNFRAKNGETHLHRAIVLGDIPIIEELIARGAVVNEGCLKQWTPLHVAAYRGLFEPLKILIAHGATVNAECDAGWTPMHYAASSGSTDIITYLYEHGATINPIENEDKNPVYVATERMFHDCVVLLLSLGADPSMKDDRGKNSFRVARTPETKDLLKDHIDNAKEQAKALAKAAKTKK